MKKFQPKIIVIFLLTIFSPVCYADVSDNDIERLLNSSGLAKQVELIPSVIKSGVNQAQRENPSMPESVVNILLLQVDNSFIPSQILRDVRLKLKFSLTERDVKQLLNWYESELGRQITALEEQSSSPEVDMIIQNQTQELLLRTKLVEYAKRIDSVLNATDFAMSLQEYTAIAVYSALIMMAQPDSADQQIEQFKTQLRASLPQMRPQVEQMMYASFVYTYQSLDNSKLDKYESFLIRPHTSKFNSVVVSGLRSGLERSIDDWALGLSNTFANMRKQNLSN